jgi:nucleotide-binding universal stress UspA family protein
MTTTPTVLCPVDFSEASRAALRYAAAIAEHFRAKLILLTVEDPLLTEALDLGAGVVWDPEVTRKELRKLAAKVFDPAPPIGVTVVYEVAIGKPAEEILRVAGTTSAALIVMSTHGLTGMRKLFFGSTTERVLRETTVPVLATPPIDPGPITFADARGLLRRMVIPLDVSAASLHQMQVARDISGTLNVPLIAVHVVEPVRTPLAAKLHKAHIEHERKTRAENTLQELLATVPRELHPESLVVYGDPAEEIAKLARDRQAGLIVIGLHGSPMLGPRMGSVTYRVLCLAPTLVLALPPVAAPSTGDAADAGADVKSLVYK